MLPVLTVFGVSLSAYLVILCTVYCFSILYFFKRQRSFSLDLHIGADLTLVVMLFSFLGARGFYILYGEWSYYSKNILEIFQFWKGGFVFFGGFILGSVAGISFLRFKKQNLGPWLDLIAPVGALGYGLGRIACFFNGCCYGQITSSFMGISFPHLPGFRHPTQLYAAFLELVIFCSLILLEKKGSFFRKRQGHLFFLWIILHGLNRLFMESLRGDFRGDLIIGISVSSFISLLLVVLGLVQIFNKPLTPRH